MSKTITIYDTSTGQIKGTYGGSNWEVQCQEGQDYIDGDFSSLEYYIGEVDGIIGPILKTPKPNRFSNFDYTLKEWVDQNIVNSREGAIRTINNVTQERIYTAYSQTKQLNMLARSAELLEIKADTGLSPGEEEELQTIKTARAWIKTKRDESNIATQAINLAQTSNEINQILTTYQEL